MQNKCINKISKINQTNKIITVKKHFYFTTVTAKLKAFMLAVDLSILPPAELVPTYMAR